MIQVAEPYRAKLRVPVVPAEESVSVSDVIAIETTATDILINVRAVPIGKATELLAGIVNVRALLSPTG